VLYETRGTNWQVVQFSYLNEDFAPRRRLNMHSINQEQEEYRRKLWNRLDRRKKLTVGSGKEGQEITSWNQKHFSLR